MESMRETIATPLTYFLRASVVLATMVLVGALATTSGADEGRTALASADSSGKLANGASGNPSISADGRFVAFDSLASNLVPRDNDDRHDIFVRDLQSRTTERVSIDIPGRPGDEWHCLPGCSYDPSISSDGSFVAYEFHTESTLDDYRSIAVHDRQTGTTERWRMDDWTVDPSISSDGRFVAIRAGNTGRAPWPYSNVAVRDRQTGTNEWVSVDASGNPADMDWDSSSGYPSISRDGRFVAFTSSSYRLVPNDTNGQTDVFVRDRQTGTTERVSVDSSETQANGSSSGATSISSDGRYVAFVSSASNLVADDTNATDDIFVRDRETGTTELVSMDGSGTQANGASSAPSISSDGRFVAFRSVASDLVEDDTNGHLDVFVRDLQTDTTQRVNVGSSGTQANQDSGSPSISSDGRFIAFESLASNLVVNDRNGLQDVFMRDWQAGTTRLVSVGDSTAPKVTRVVPTEGATGIARKTNVVATFSERMDKNTLTKTTFELYKLLKNPDGTTTTRQITNVTVRPSSDGLEATLNPYGASEGALAENTRYEAVVNEGALDAFGNRLDQNHNDPGKQAKVWYFKTKK